MAKSGRPKAASTELLDELLGMLNSVARDDAPSSKRSGRTAHKDGENHALLKFDLSCLRFALERGDIVDAVERAIMATIRAMQLDELSDHLKKVDARQSEADKKQAKRRIANSQSILEAYAAILEEHIDAQTYTHPWRRGAVINEIGSQTGLCYSTIAKVIPPDPHRLSVKS